MSVNFRKVAATVAVFAVLAAAPGCSRAMEASESEASQLQPVRYQLERLSPEENYYAVASHASNSGTLRISGFIRTLSENTEFILATVQSRELSSIRPLSEGESDIPYLECPADFVYKQPSDFNSCILYSDLANIKF